MIKRKREHKKMEKSKHTYSYTPRICKIQRVLAYMPKQRLKTLLWVNPKIVNFCLCGYSRV